MRILGIDPGPEKSAFVVTQNTVPIQKGIMENEKLLFDIRWDFADADATHMAIEMVQSFGMPVGKEIFETVYWIGRFVEAWGDGETPSRTKAVRLFRSDIKNHICHISKAKDSNIRQALIDRFGQPGMKKNPGCTYGLSGDMWSALAVAVTLADMLTNPVRR